MKRLRRGNGKLFGVCEGLGKYLGIDPVVLRIAFVIAIIIYGTGLWLYIVLAIILPKK